MGSEGGLDCEMVGVFPNSSLETPASEDVGIAIQRHGWSCHGRESESTSRGSACIVERLGWDALIIRDFIAAKVGLFAAQGRHQLESERRNEAWKLNV